MNPIEQIGREIRTQGFRNKIYGIGYCLLLIGLNKIEIRISLLSHRRCDEIMECCGRRVETLEHLVDGDFPKELKEMFF